MEWVFVNGARIERKYLAANVSEARQAVWTLSNGREVQEHTHCIICNIAIARGDDCYQADCGWICLSCHRRFIEGDEAV